MLETLEKTIIICIIFVLGMLVSSVYQDVRASQEIPTQTAQPAIADPSAPLIAQNSPSDWLKEDSIHVYNTQVVLSLENAQWAQFTDTHSMEPVLSAKANAIEVVPTSPDQINVGDIVSYQSAYADGTIIHRVVEKGTDKDGVYFRFKGDNNPEIDPGKVRFSQVKRVVVAIIY